MQHQFMPKEQRRRRCFPALTLRLFPWHRGARMTAQASSDVNALPVSPPDYPRPHYEQHPSGLRQIEIAELLPYNLGSALKYVWRHAHKGEAAGDLEKALYHIDRELTRLPEEQAESRAHLGLGKDGPTGAWPSILHWSSARTRITDRLRLLEPFRRDQDFIACVTFYFSEYQLAEARTLVRQHLNRYRTESPSP